jgi:ElaB/YqjD/DUF883 family membrane-anchored ribosome-binding protein
VPTSSTAAADRAKSILDDANSLRATLDEILRATYEHADDLASSSAALERELREVQDRLASMRGDRTAVAIVASCVRRASRASR